MYKDQNSARTFLRDAGCKKAARILPIASLRTTHVAEGIWFSIIELTKDDMTPHGIFSISAAVAQKKEDSIRKAIFEACERYCLAGIRYHEHRFLSATDIDNSDIFSGRYRFQFTTGNNSADIQLIECLKNEKYTSRYRYLRTCDVFAPLPFIHLDCSFLPSTNGVACGSSLKTALKGALNELTERSLIMEFWYTGERNHFYRVESSDLPFDYHPALTYLKKLGYSVYFIIRPSCESILTWTFCINRKNEYPYFFCSAGTKTSLDESLSSSVNEAVQTLIALSQMSKQAVSWLRSGMPFSNLEHHMFYYAIKEISGQAVEAFMTEFSKLDSYSISSGATSFEHASIPFSMSLAELSIVDITPKIFNTEFTVCRVFSESALPLLVGEKLAPAALIKHKNRIRYPHPFP